MGGAVAVCNNKSVGTYAVGLFTSASIIFSRARGKKKADEQFINRSRQSILKGNCQIDC